MARAALIGRRTTSRRRPAYPTERSRKPSWRRTIFRTCWPRILTAIKTALEKGGVQFIDAGPYSGEASHEPVAAPEDGRQNETALTKSRGCEGEYAVHIPHGRCSSALGPVTGPPPRIRYNLEPRISTPFASAIVKANKLTVLQYIVLITAATIKALSLCLRMSRKRANNDE